METPKHSGEKKAIKRPTISAPAQGKTIWWAEKNPTGWDSVEEALRRTWEKDRATHHLTLEQAGKRAAKSKSGSHDDQGHDEPLADTDRDFASGDRASAASAKGENTTDPSLRAILPGELKAFGRDEDWSHLQRAGRYGFAARAQFPEHAEWNPKLVKTLKGDWHQVSAGRSWDESEDGVRRGWELAKPDRA